MTPQERMQDLLGKSGIPAKQINCFSRQIQIECWSLSAARRFAALLAKMGVQPRGPVECLRENERNENTVLRPSQHTVWCVGGTLR